MFVRWLVKTLIVSLLIAAAGIAAWTWFSLTYVFSVGERAGYVQKFSQKGWVFKTWEGELAMVNLPGAMPEIFTFSVRDKAAVSKVQSSMGNRVVLKYNEHKFIPTKIFAETSYFVIDARSVDAAAPAAPLPATK